MNVALLAESHMQAAPGFTLARRREDVLAKGLSTPKPVNCCKNDAVGNVA